MTIETRTIDEHDNCTRYLNSAFIVRLLVSPRVRWYVQISKWILHSYMHY